MRKAGDIILEIFREKFGSDFMENTRSTAGLFSSWAEVVKEVWSYTERKTAAGSEDVPAAAVHSRIKEFERGMLLVEADHPGWIQILQSRQTELLSAIQRRYPKMDIHAIAFRLSREPFA